MFRLSRQISQSLQKSQQLINQFSKKQNIIRPSFNNNLFLQNKYQFCSKNPQQNEQQIIQENQKDEKTDNFTTLHDEKSKAFFDYLKDTIVNNQNIELQAHQFSNYKIYSNSTKLKEKVRMNLAYGGFWLFASVLTFQYIPYFYGAATMIPGWFFAGNMVQFTAGTNYIKKLVSTMELNKAQDTVKLTMGNGKIIDVSIDEINFIDIIELHSYGGTSIKESQGEKHEELTENNHFVAVFDIFQGEKVEHHDLRLLITDKIISVENITLLRHILLGETDEVKKFEFIDLEDKQKDAEKQQEEEDLELERQLEEEINALKDKNNEKQEEKQNKK